jgi:hypothetical protein
MAYPTLVINGIEVMTFEPVEQTHAGHNRVVPANDNWIPVSGLHKALGDCLNEEKLEQLKTALPTTFVMVYEQLFFEVTSKKAEVMASILGTHVKIEECAV